MITDSLRKSVSLLLCSFFLSGISFSQTVIYVDTDASAGGDGTSWAHAYRNLQNGLLSSSSGDEIWVAEGFYRIIGDEDTSFEIPDGVAVYGGFNGTEVNRSERNWVSNLTELDGNNYSNTVVYFENSSTSTILDGFTIKDGYADGFNQRGQSGAGIYLDIVGAATICSPQIRNCIIKDHHADKGGGAMYVDGSFSGVAAPYFENCTFDNNFSNADGGAIYNNGIWDGAVNATFIGCTFSNNHSVGSGGAIFSHGGHGDVSSNFKKCDFDGNLAEGNGGAMYSLGTSQGKANHNILNCRFYANKGFAAGGIYNNGGNTDGDASPNIINCTFYLNEAIGNGGTGGAIYNNGSNGGQSNTIIKNCIIWGNIAPYGTHVLKNVDCSPSISYCLVDADDCNELNNGSGSAINCGAGILYELGHTPDFMDANNGDLRITENSDAKNTGDNSGISEIDDLDGNNRFVGTVDMGAYEQSAAPLPVELLSFTASAKNDMVVLEWTTVTEIENMAFSVERSTDGRNFETIANLEGAGNSNAYINYKALDQKPMEGPNYYRLKTISFSGQIEYSQIRLVEFNRTNNEWSLYPNPVQSELYLTGADQLNENTTYRIYSIYGQELMRGRLNSDGHKARIDLSGNNLIPGHYFIELFTEGQSGVYHRFQKIN